MKRSYSSGAEIDDDEEPAGEVGKVVVVVMAARVIAKVMAFNCLVEA